MKEANLHHNEAALANYTAVIDGADTPPDLRAMALYNRAVVYAATNNDSQAVDDLETLLEMAGAAPNVKTEARRKLVRMRRSSDQPAGGPTTRDA